MEIRGLGEVCTSGGRGRETLYVVETLYTILARVHSQGGPRDSKRSKACATSTATLPSQTRRWAWRSTARGPRTRHARGKADFDSPPQQAGGLPTGNRQLNSRGSRPTAAGLWPGVRITEAVDRRIACSGREVLQRPLSGVSVERVLRLHSKALPHLTVPPSSGPPHPT
jgi:hypothetical protein